MSSAETVGFRAASVSDKLPLVHKGLDGSLEHLDRTCCRCVGLSQELATGCHCQQSEEVQHPCTNQYKFSAPVQK